MAENPTHRYVGNHARGFALENGKEPMLAPGEFLTLSKEDEDTYKEDIKNGILLPVGVTKKEGGKS